MRLKSRPFPGSVMRLKSRPFPGSVMMLTVCLATAPSCAVHAQQDGSRCDSFGAVLTGRASTVDGVCRVNLPRGDLGVTLLGATLPPGMGLTSWAAFVEKPDGESIVMGDLVLTPDELPAVMSGLRANGLDATAVHRHMLGEVPDIVFMHYMGTGPGADLARRLRAALDRAPSALGATPRQASGTAGVVAGVTCAALEEALGVNAGSADTGPGFCKVSVPRPEREVTMDGVRLPPGPTGIASWYAFRQTDDGTAAVIAGDMALRETQVNSAIGTLREHDIDIVVLHNHMMGEEPRIAFFHFQARGEPLTLARALKAAMDAVNTGGT